MKSEENDIFTFPKLCSLSVQKKFYCSDSKSYIICGGLGGYGFELTNWLVHRGAKNVIISSRRGEPTGYQKRKIGNWQSRGTKVIICTDDITEEEGVENLLQIANVEAPVEAIFNFAVVLKDAFIENQNSNTFLECVKTKVNSTFYLDQLSRQMCPQLKYFVVYSSIGAEMGNIGITNYGMANSTVERICEKRKAENLPATAIQLGPMGDVGILTDKISAELAVLSGIVHQPLISFFPTMDCLLTQPNPLVRSIILDKKDTTKFDGTDFVNTISKTIGWSNRRKVDRKTKIIDCGIDSIALVELKHCFEKEYNIVMSIKDIRELTIGQILEGSKTLENNKCR